MPDACDDSSECAFCNITATIHVVYDAECINKLFYKAAAYLSLWPEMVIKYMAQLCYYRYHK